jgi:hypothetical protein
MNWHTVARLSRTAKVMQENAERQRLVPEDINVLEAMPRQEREEFSNIIVPRHIR